MRNFLLTIALVLAACVASYCGFYSMSRDPEAVREAIAEHDAMGWLRMEFKLTDQQFAAIKALHETYNVQCAEHCALIIEAREQEAPQVEIARLESICEGAMTEHFRQVASLMAPVEGRRYLEIILPRVASYDHRQAPNLQANP